MRGRPARVRDHLARSTHEGCSLLHARLESAQHILRRQIHAGRWQRRWLWLPLLLLLLPLLLLLLPQLRHAGALLWTTQRRHGVLEAIAARKCDDAHSQ